MEAITVSATDDPTIIADLFHQVDLHYYGDQAATPRATARYVSENIRSAHWGVQVAVAYSGETPVGIATYSVLYPAPRLAGQLFMKDLFVVKHARGAGVGRALMRFLARVALETGCERFDWTTESDNPDAMAWYEALGADRVQEKVYYRMTGAALADLATAD